MSLLRDVVVTLGDALRLSSDLMAHKVEIQTKTFQRCASRLMWFMTIYVAVTIGAILSAAVGIGFILYGVFILAAQAAGCVAAGLIVGFVLLLLAVCLSLAARSIARWS